MCCNLQTAERITVISLAGKLAHPQQRGDISVVHDGMCVLVCVANILSYLPAMQLKLVVIATIIGKL